MYYINKIVGYIANPLIVTAFLALLAIILRKFKCCTIAKVLAVVSVVWLWFWATPLAGLIVGLKLEQEFLVEGRVPLVESIPVADAIVLLGGSMGINTNLSSYAEMSASADRVWQTTRLWKAGKAPVILATSHQAKETTGDLMCDFGVPSSAIVYLDDARNTEEEAKAIQDYLIHDNKREPQTYHATSITHGGPKIILVTSAWHMKRARLMFMKYAPQVQVVCSPSDFEFSRSGKPYMPLWRILLPDSNILAQNCVAIHEWLGLVGYNLFR